MCDMQKRTLPIRPIKDRDTANAFLLGLLFNQNQKAERAWTAPYTLRDRLGTLLPKKVIALPSQALIEAVGVPTALHPFVERMSQHVHNICGILIERYDGDARNIWKPVQTTTELLRRLQEFPGIGKHKATVGVFLLKHELGVPVQEDGTRLNIRSTCPNLYQLYGEGE